MKTLFASGLIFSIAVISSCSISSLTGEEKNPELVPVIINNEYSMDIPSYMSKTTLLNEDASLQFQNVFKEAYVIVIDESKQEFVDALIDADSYDSTHSVVVNYAETQLDFTTSAMDVTAKKNLVKLNINGLTAVKTELEGTVEGVKAPISFFLTYIESDEKLYMVMAWTLKDRKERFQATFEKMAKTFKCVRDKPLAFVKD